MSATLREIDEAVAVFLDGAMVVVPPEYGGVAVTAGSVRVMDATCPAIHAALQAAEKGVPFMPLRGLIGSDLINVRPDWRVINNPFAARGDPIVLLPAIRPDVALFHAPMA